MVERCVFREHETESERYLAEARRERAPAKKALTSASGCSTTGRVVRAMYGEGVGWRLERYIHTVQNRLPFSSPSDHATSGHEPTSNSFAFSFGLGAGLPGSVLGPALATIKNMIELYKKLIVSSIVFGIIPVRNATT